MNWHAITAGLSVVASAIASVDHYLAGNKGIVPNSAWQLVKMLITNQPVRANEGVKDMFKFLDELEAGIKRMAALAEDGLTAVSKLADFAGKIAPVAAQIAPLCGPAGAEVAAGAAAAEVMAPVVGKTADAVDGALKHVGDQQAG